MTTSHCPSGTSTQLPPNQPLQLLPQQPLTIAYLLCCGAKHLYVDATELELKGSLQQQD
jgi:hypothetical protein